MLGPPTFFFPAPRRGVATRGNWAQLRAHAPMVRSRLPGWVDSDEEVDEIAPKRPKRQRKRQSEVAPPATHTRASHAPKKDAHRTWLDDPLLPHTVDMPIRERLRAFVWSRNPDLRTPEDASNLTTLLMTLMTTCTSRYTTLDSLLLYARMALPSDFQQFLREHVLRKGGMPGADEEYVAICYAAVATFAAL